MRKLLPSFLILCIAAPIVGASATVDKVFVRKPMAFLVRPAEVAVRCGQMQVTACTAFVGQRLFCECVVTGGKWQIDAHAQFIPVMFLFDPGDALHESEHVRDIEHLVEGYVEDLEERRFDSEEACTTEAAAHVSRFPRTMDEFKTRSTSARHPRAPHREPADARRNSVPSRAGGDRPPW